ncbi:hypothetical protein EKO27_g10893 [Xylaria grammica]|uniref:Uncharacterized protein n=1 Tax=Xylaria grammica TaxID=363999 RepID=A0A439CPY4_9PEZI|nr:hypothetical protein F5X98DRAFT_173876 [Xylaria grammica]RWA04215.1 hypothetical protein EKO27_g10893 [Xylaria grammica]
MNPPHARSQGVVGQNQAGRESDLFSRGMSWAVCFFEGENPQVQEFRPPRAGDLANQSVAVHVPYHHLHLFVTYIRQGHSSWQPGLKDAAGHCRLRVFKCDSWGAPHQWPHTFYARWDRRYREEHFTFDAILPLQGELKPGQYFIDCEFYRGQWEYDDPDARYTTGVFDVA